MDSTRTSGDLSAEGPGRDEHARLVTDLWREKEAHRETKNRCQFLLDLLHKQTRDMRQMMRAVQPTSNSTANTPSHDSAGDHGDGPTLVQSLEKEKHDLQRSVGQLQAELQETLSRMRLENERLTARVAELEAVAVAVAVAPSSSAAPLDRELPIEMSSHLAAADLSLCSLLSAIYAPAQDLFPLIGDLGWGVESLACLADRAQLAAVETIDLLQMHAKIDTVLHTATLVQIQSDADVDADDEDREHAAQEKDDAQEKKPPTENEATGDKADAEGKDAGDKDADVFNTQRAAAKAVKTLDQAAAIVHNLSAANDLLKAAANDTHDVKQRYASLLMKESRKFEQARKEYEEEIARLRARDAQRLKELETLRQSANPGEAIPYSDPSTRRPSVLEEKFRKQALPSPQRVYEKSGWLVKQGSKWKTWKTRFFVLRGSSLMIYKDAEKRVLMGIISITGVQCRSTETNAADKRFYFEIKAGASGMMGQKNDGDTTEIIRYSNIHLHTSSDAERTEWISAINDNALLDV